MTVSDDWHPPYSQVRLLGVVHALGRGFTAGTSYRYHTLCEIPLPFPFTTSNRPNPLFTCMVCYVMHSQRVL
jgi:hypothetical protein